MYVVALHDIVHAETAFSRGQRLITGDGAPTGVRVLQFYPSSDAARVTCLWESPSVDAVQAFVDETLGGSSVNTCYEVDDAKAFAERPLAIQSAPVPA
jgi:hypothetical protein